MADLTTQLSLGSRGHWGKFNWVQSSTSYTASCLGKSVAVDFGPVLFQRFLSAAKRNKSPNHRGWTQHCNPAAPYACISIHGKTINKPTDPKNTANQELSSWSPVAGCHDDSQPISSLRGTDFLEEPAFAVGPEVSEWAHWLICSVKQPLVEIGDINWPA